MIKKLPVIWLAPEGMELPRFRLITEVEINGLTIPAGFITDGASIPWGARNNFNPLGQGFIAAVAHDYRYAMKHPAKEANDLFYRDLLDCGVNKIKAKLMYAAVEVYRVVKRLK